MRARVVNNAAAARPMIRGCSGDVVCETVSIE
jgi:hypothetical protein